MTNNKSNPKVEGVKSIDDIKADILGYFDFLNNILIENYSKKSQESKEKGGVFTTGKYATMVNSFINRKIDEASEKLIARLGEKPYRQAMEEMLVYIGVLPEKIKDIPNNKCLLSLFLTYVELKTQKNGVVAYGLGADLVAYYLMKDKTLPRPENIITAKGNKADKEEVNEVTPDMIVSDGTDSK